jgi:hypothetical protein
MEHQHGRALDPALAAPDPLAPPDVDEELRVVDRNPHRVTKSFTRAIDSGASR